jgi:hypothetical protein
MNWVGLAGSLAAVFVVAGLVKLLGLGRGGALDEATARQVAGDIYIGHRFTSAIVAADGRAALVEGSEGEIALVRPHGDKWVARLLSVPAEAKAQGDALIIAAGETMFGATTLTLGAAEAARWAAKLRGEADA